MSAARSRSAVQPTRAVNPDLVTRVLEQVVIPGFPPVGTPPDYGLDEPGFFALPVGNPEQPAGSATLPANASVTVNLLPFTVVGGSDTLFIGMVRAE